MTGICKAPPVKNDTATSECGQNVTNGTTCTPTIAPTSFPTPTPFPTVSSLPVGSPTALPTPNPTISAYPSALPTAVPSPSPTMTLSPTWSPTVPCYEEILNSVSCGKGCKDEESYEPPRFRVVQCPNNTKPDPSSAPTPVPSTARPTPVPTTPVPTVTFNPTLLPTTEYDRLSNTFMPTSIAFGERGKFVYANSVLATIVILFVMYGVLQLLVSMTTKRAKPQIEKGKADPFRDPQKGQDWNWDFAMAFKVLDEDAHKTMTGKKNEFRRNNTLRKVLDKLRKGGLETKCFYSRDRDKVFVKIRASRERLCREADRINLKVPLDGIEIQKRMAEGSKKADGSWQWFPRLYGDDIMANLEDDDWCAVNYKRGVTMKDRTEKVLLRKNDEKSKLLPEEEKEIVGVITPIQDTLQLSLTPFYKNIYGEYSTDEHKQPLYLKQWRTSSPFRGVDRLKLIISIIECRESEGGCQYEYAKALSKEQNCLEGFFPLHDEDELLPCINNVIDVYTMPWNINCDALKDYFGEKIGLYYRWAAHYTTFLAVASGAGFITFLTTTGFFNLTDTICYYPSSPDTGYFGAKVDGWFVPYFCVFMSFWSVFYLESWKNAQITCAQRWGMHGSEEEQLPRPEFMQNPENIEINSPVTGEPEFYFPPDESTRRKNIGAVVTLLSVLVCMCGVFIVFMFKQATADTSTDNYAIWVIPSYIAFWTEQGDPIYYGCAKDEAGVYEDGCEPKSLKGFPFGGPVAGILNSVQILVLGSLYAKIAAWFNNWENHRLNTEFEDALIVRTFMFEFINSYGALTYIAFIKVPLGARTELFPPWFGQGMHGAAEMPYSCSIGKNKQPCLMEISNQLFSIFAVKLLSKNITTVVLPYFKQNRKEVPGVTLEPEDLNAEFEAPVDANPLGSTKRMRSKVECEFDLEEYPLIEGPFDSYKEMVFQFGYATLFAAAYPLAPLLAFISNYVDIRSDLYNMGLFSRRPIPANAEDIGSWEGILDTMGTAAIISNSALVCLTGNFLEGYSWQTRLLLFALMEHGLIICKVILSMMLPDVPEEVELQLERQEFICSKLLNDDEDEMEMPEEGDALSNEAACVIYNFDSDTTLKAHVKERANAEVRLRKKEEDAGQSESKQLATSDEVGTEMVLLGEGAGESKNEKDV